MGDPETTLFLPAAADNTEAPANGSEACAEAINKRVAQSDGVDGPIPKRLKTSDAGLAASTITSPVRSLGPILPYDAATRESRPKLAIYCPEYTAALDMVPTILDKFLTTFDKISDDGHSSPELEVSKKNIIDYRRIEDHYRALRPVVLLGPAGAGKSSTLNCILSETSVAVESDMGVRGTSVVHEYKTAKPMQTSLYCVDVHFMHHRMISHIVESKCSAIFLAMKSDDNNHDSEDFEEIQAQSTAAMEFFNVLLCNHAKFEDTDAISEFFSARRNGDVKTIAVTIVDKIMELMREEKLEDHVKTSCADTDEELAYIFAENSAAKLSSSSSPSPSLWPLIRTVTVHRRKDLLDTGLVLADAPGNNDTDQSVTQSTLAYLSRAGDILIFAKAARAASDSSVPTNLRECLTRCLSPRMHLVIIGIDQKTDLKPAERQALKVADGLELTAAEEHVQMIQREIATWQAEDARLVKIDNLESLRESRHVRNKIGQLELDRIAARTKVKQEEIKIRNRMIEEAIRKELGKMPGLNKIKLELHFVSNTEYQKHVAGYDPKDPPILDIEATGVPALRQMLYSVPSIGRLNRLSEIVRRILPSMLEGIIAILSRPRLDRKKDVESLIEGTFRQLFPALEERFAHIKSCFTERMRECLNTHESKWNERAELLVQGWSDNKANVFRAMCRNHGVWNKPKGLGNLDWLQPLQALFAKKLEGVLDATESDLDLAIGDVEATIGLVFAQVAQKLKTCKDFQGVDQKHFFHNLRDNQRALVRVMTNLLIHFKAKVTQISSRATMGGNESYPAKALKDTFQAGFDITKKPDAVIYVQKGDKKVKRTGAHAARVILLRQKINGEETGRSIFAEICESVSVDFETTVQKVIDVCAEKSKASVDATLKGFDDMFSTAEVKEETPESVEAGRRLKEAAQEALVSIRGPLKLLVEQAEAYEAAGKAAANKKA